MLTHVDFVSKAVFEETPARAGRAVISIGNPAEWPPAKFRDHERALRVEFLDCDQEGLSRWGYPEEALMQPEQFAEVLGFIQGLAQAREPWQLLVHCHMGASRSAAVALVAHVLTGCQFDRLADAHYANLHVLELAQAALGVAIERPPLPNDDHPYLPSTKVLLPL